MTALVPIGDMERMAKAIAGSGLFGIKKPEEALALMIVAEAEGRHPGSVAAEYHIIQGRPALKADALLARFQHAGGKVAWDAYTDEKVSAVFTHDAGGSVKIEWTIDRAKKAGLTGKDNWTKYPRQMLRARVISEGVRTCFPAVCVGVYTPEEVQDFEPAKRERKAKDMGNAEVVDPETGEVQQTTGQQSASQGDHTGSPIPPVTAAPSYITADQAIHLEDRAREIGLTKEALCKAAKVERLSQIEAQDYKRAVAWLDKHADKMADATQP